MSEASEDGATTAEDAPEDASAGGAPSEGDAEVESKAVARSATPGSHAGGHAHAGSRHPAIPTAIAVVCGYELVADGINTFLQEPIMPSATTFIRRFRGRTVAAKLAPHGLRMAAALAGGYAIGIVVKSSRA